VGVIGGARKRFNAFVVGGALAISGLVRLDGRMKTHGCRGRSRTVSYRTLPASVMPLSRYRQTPCGRSTGA
jgi:hypothetical protein